jgi:hypothetical protein
LEKNLGVEDATCHISKIDASEGVDFASISTNAV